MPQVTIIDFSGNRRTVQAESGLSLMEVATRNGIDGIIAACGGACSCATCLVHVHEDWFGRLDEASDAEQMMLEFALHPQANSRLSCQIVLSDSLDGLIVELPESQV